MRSGRSLFREKLSMKAVTAEALLLTTQLPAQVLCMNQPLEKPDENVQTIHHSCLWLQTGCPNFKA